jgi:hypothetical protein
MITEYLFYCLYYVTIAALQNELKNTSFHVWKNSLKHVHRVLFGTSGKQSLFEGRFGEWFRFVFTGGGRVGEFGGGVGGTCGFYW